MIKCVLFDLGGVVVDFSDEDYYRYLAKQGKLTPEQVYKKLDPLYRRIFMGLIRIDFFEREVARILKIERSKVRWIEFYESHVKLNEKMMQLVRKLRKTYKVAFLSNVDYSRYDIAMSMLNLKEFDYHFASCYIGKNKPDPEVYRHVLKRMRMKPSEVVFIDNLNVNVIGAASVGIRSIWFMGSMSELTKKLRSFGVKA